MPSNKLISFTEDYFNEQNFSKKQEKTEGPSDIFNKKGKKVELK